MIALREANLFSYAQHSATSCAAVRFTQSALSSVVVAWAFAGQAAIPAKRDLYDWATSRDQNRRGVGRRMTYVASWARWRAYARVWPSFAAIVECAVGQRLCRTGR